MQIVSSAAPTQQLQATTVRTRLLATPVITASATTALGSDQLQLNGNVSTASAMTEAQAREALTALKAKYGSLRKPGFFKNPKIDINEAIDRLKRGKTVMFYNKAAGDIRDRFNSFNELALLDDLQGRQKNHGVSKPELRLPLLFLGDQKLKEYNGDDQLDPYNAYRFLKKGWRIVINGKTVKPEDLVSHVMNNGLTRSKDPGNAVRAQFDALPGSGWMLQGKEVSRDLAYLAWIAGDRQLTLDGVAVQNQKDFDTLMTLVANAPNKTLSADMHQRLKNLHLNQFSSPVANLYSVYKHLEQGQALKYAGNTLHNLNEMVIYDALNGSQKPTDLLAGNLQNALRYLGQDNGLSTGSAFKAWQSLKTGENITYRFNGGPTGEAIRFSASNLNEVLQLQQKVVAQRQRDQFRPDFGNAKQILKNRLPQVGNHVQERLNQTRRAVDKARQDIPVQEGRLADAQSDYRRIKPDYDRASRALQDAERNEATAKRRFDRDQQSYNWVRRDYDRLNRDLRNAENGARQATRNASSYDNKAREADRLASSDPDNAAKHRQNAARYRQQAQQSRQQAAQYQQNARHLRGRIDSKRWDLRRAEQELNYSRRDYQEAQGETYTRRSHFNTQRRLLNDASSRQRNAENQLRMARQTVADGEVLESVVAKMSAHIQRISSAMQRANSYKDYASVGQSIQQAAAELKALTNDDTYRRVHGKGAQELFTPLHTLLRNLEKPAA